MYVHPDLKRREKPREKMCLLYIVNFREDERYFKTSAGMENTEEEKREKKASSLDDGVPKKEWSSAPLSGRCRASSYHRANIIDLVHKTLENSEERKTKKEKRKDLTFLLPFQS